MVISEFLPKRKGEKNERKIVLGWQRVAVVNQCVAACCSVLQCVAVCCSVL